MQEKHQFSGRIQKHCKRKSSINCKKLNPDEAARIIKVNHHQVIKLSKKRVYPIKIKILPNQNVRRQRQSVINVTVSQDIIAVKINYIIN